MSQIERKVIITYRWWNDDKEVKPEHVQALEEHAYERVFEMSKQGYTSGELCANIRVTDDDPEDGVEYLGWWERKEETVYSQEISEVA